MSKNSQILLEQLLNTKFEEFDEYQDKDDFFEFYSASLILQEKELSYDEIKAGICGKSLDGGVDSAYIFVDAELITEIESIKSNARKGVEIEFVIIQSKNSTGFGEEPLLKFGKIVENLFDLEFSTANYSQRYNSNLIYIFDLFRNAYLKLVSKSPKLKISIKYAAKGIDIHANVQQQADELKKNIEKTLTGSNAKVDFLGAEALFNLAIAAPNNSINLKFAENFISTQEQVFVGLAKLSNYYKFITNDNGDLQRHIFESNVRDYQGKTIVNKEIKQTLEENISEDFWWLNNGVTILSSETNPVGTKELVIHNPEIVNGLQTSTEIANYFRSFPEKLHADTRDLLVRVIVPDSEESRDKIIRATNSQTPIPKASLRATDNIHRQIEEYLKPYDLFYDRRKNYYKNQGKKPKEIVSIPFMSQCLMATILQKPNFARARPSTLLEDDTSYSKMFNENSPLETYLIVAKSGKFTEQEIRSKGKYEITEVNDILYYVIYVNFGITCKTQYPTAQQISTIGLESFIDKDKIKIYTNFVYDEYKSLGGNDSVAKGSDLLVKCKEFLQKSFC